MNRFSGAASTTMDSHVGISFPQQRKPSFQPIQPQIRPPFMTAGSFEDEPPLLEELGINTPVILRKTLNLLNPMIVNADLHEDADLAGRYGSLDLYRCVSFVGYCLLPMVIFSALQLFLPRSGLAVLVIACLAVIWCTRACCTLLIMSSPHAEEQRSLIGYACALIYTTFSLLIIF
ncbi:hypothetical protein GOP47_0001599 [Adiantum capillus-veneris]|uniref:Protein YIPF n=1 Tax=Adiantum capillus-veneris TaxID=13818 RepID=A0A9D4V8K1_ADICA|nr:hypothetical protein GOP47_0001599 [Adiantum capillus-veneris]